MEFRRVLFRSSFLGIPWEPEAEKINKAFVDMVQASVGVVRVPLPFTAMGRGVAGRRFLVDYFTPMVPERRAGTGEDIFTHICQSRDEAVSDLSAEAIVDPMIFLSLSVLATTP